MRREDRALRVGEPAERIGEVRERRLERHVVRVYAVTERQRVPDQRTADRPLRDVDDVVLEPAPVRPAREIAAENAEAVPLAERRGRGDPQVEPELVRDLSAREVQV